jgi:hypothetical protein
VYCLRSADLRDSVATMATVCRYHLPLAELGGDFYDELKSISSGYASFDYEEAEYRWAVQQYMYCFCLGQYNSVDNSRAAQECSQEQHECLSREASQLRGVPAGSPACAPSPPPGL